MFRLVYILFLSISFSYCYANDSLYLKLHFVYGSKPAHAYKNVEKKQFGGIHGGHVYMEVNDKIISFGTNNGKWHIFPRKSKSAGKYRIDKDLTWHGDTAAKKITTIIIPITEEQLVKFKEVENRYFEKAPYDYAFFGMRCAAGAYDVLDKAKVCPHKTRWGIISKNFYPKRLRVKLLRRAQKEHWAVIKQEGRKSRKWERD
ncbi:MAG: hypothetical protein V4677_03765 [Bacteroidota bacterium]